MASAKAAALDALMACNRCRRQARLQTARVANDRAVWICASCVADLRTLLVGFLNTPVCVHGVGEPSDGINKNDSG